METRTIGLFEAKTHLSELVARAEQGGEVIITRHNKPVAKIVPVHVAPPFDAERRSNAVAALRALGREIEKKQGPLTTDEIVRWVREVREERTDRILKAATRKK